MNTVLTLWLDLVEKITPGMVKFTMPGVFLFCSTFNWATGVLSFHQTRVILENGTREFVLDFTNPGEDSVEYTLSFKHLEMRPDGTLEEIPDEEVYPWFADPYLLLSSNQVKMAPGETQSLTISVTSPTHPEKGEYRTHLYFRSVVPQHTSAAQKTHNTQALIGITIPVILRMGNFLAETSIDSLGFSMINDTLPVLNYHIRRSGIPSVAGEIKITYISPLGRNVLVAIQRNVVIYSTCNEISSNIVLCRKKGVNYSAGKIMIEYTMTRNEPENLLSAAMIDLSTGKMEVNRQLSGQGSPYLTLK